MQWAAVRMTYLLRMVPPQKPRLFSSRRRACADKDGAKLATTHWMSLKFEQQDDSWHLVVDRKGKLLLGVVPVSHVCPSMYVCSMLRQREAQKTKSCVRYLFPLTMGLVVQIYYLPWTFPWWTILSIDNAGHTHHLRDD